MVDTKEFSRLFKVNIPYEKELNYYLTLLGRSKAEWFFFFFSPHGLSPIQMAERFQQFEADIAPLRVSEYRKRCMERLLEYISNTAAYKEFNTMRMAEKKVNEEIDLTTNDNEIVLSVDMCDANYSILKSFDANGELHANWLCLCKILNVHDILIASKSFRQLIFGNLNPRRNQKMQKNYMDTVRAKLPEQSFAFVSHDEFWIKTGVVVKNDDEIEVSLPERIGEIRRILSTENKFSLRKTYFKLRRIAPDEYVKHEFEDVDGDRIVRQIPESRHLYKVPGNKFYMRFKQYVLNEAFDKRDLYFQQDGELASWVVDKE